MLSNSPPRSQSRHGRCHETLLLFQQTPVRAPMHSVWLERETPAVGVAHLLFPQPALQLPDPAEHAGQSLFVVGLVPQVEAHAAGEQAGEIEHASRRLALRTGEPLASAAETGSRPN